MLLGKHSLPEIPEAVWFFLKALKFCLVINALRVTSFRSPRTRQGSLITRPPRSSSFCSFLLGTPGPSNPRRTARGSTRGRHSAWAAGRLQLQRSPSLLCCRPPATPSLRHQLHRIFMSNQPVLQVSGEAISLHFQFKILPSILNLTPLYAFSQFF